MKGIASNPRGRGFWLFNAQRQGGGVRRRPYPPRPVPLTTIVGMASSATGQGYLLLDAAGNVYPYGDAVFYGEAPGRLGPFRQIVATPDHKGYWLLSSTGRVYGFGDAHTYGPQAGPRQRCWLLRRPGPAHRTATATGKPRSRASSGTMATPAR